MDRVGSGVAAAVAVGVGCTAGYHAGSLAAMKCAGAGSVLGVVASRLAVGARVGVSSVRLRCGRVLRGVGFARGLGAVVDAASSLGSADAGVVEVGVGGCVGCGVDGRKSDGDVGVAGRLGCRVGFASGRVGYLATAVGSAGLYRCCAANVAGCC